MKTNIHFRSYFAHFFYNKNISHKICREIQNTHFMFSNIFSKNRAVYEIMWKNTVELDRPQMTICHMRMARCIPKATNTHLELAILTTFPLQM